MKSSKTIATILITVSLIKAPSSYARETSSIEKTNTDDVYTLIVIGAFVLIYFLFWLPRAKRLNALNRESSKSYKIPRVSADVPATTYPGKLAFDHSKNFNDQELEIFKKALSITLQKKESSSQGTLGHH